MSEKKKLPVQGLLIVFMPVLVIAAVYFIFPNTVSERDSLLSALGTTNHGQLVEPAVTIDGVVGTRENGDPKWQLMIVDDGSCQQRCQQALFITRQIHKLMPKRANRFERAFITTSTLNEEAKSLLAEQYPTVQTLENTDGQLQQLLASTNVPWQENGVIYLVDPRGYLVLYYLEEQHYQQQGDYKKIIKDLKVLL